MTRNMEMKSSTNWSRRLRVSMTFNEAIIASRADPGPTPLMVEYVPSTPRKQIKARKPRNHVDGIGRRVPLVKGKKPQSDKEQQADDEEIAAGVENNRFNGLAQRFSITKRQAPQTKKAAVIHHGRNCTCGASEKASANKVQGRLSSNEPSVPRALAILFIQAEQRQRLEALSPMCFAM